MNRVKRENIFVHHLHMWKYVVGTFFSFEVAE
jgi:hypothetical protein